MTEDLLTKLDLAQERVNATLEATEKFVVQMERIAVALKSITEEQRALKDIMSTCKEGRQCCLDRMSKCSAETQNRFNSLEKDMLWVKIIFGSISLLILIGGLLIKLFEAHG